MKWVSVYALGWSMVAAACVGDTPADSTPPTSNADGSAPCSGESCVDSGGLDAATNVPGAGGGDAAPAACSKIQVTTLAGTVEGLLNGPGADARFKRPEGITVDPATGTLFVADTGNRLVRKVLSDGTTTTYSNGIWYTPRHASFSAWFNSLFICDPENDQVFAVATDGMARAEIGLSSVKAFAIQPPFNKFVVSPTEVARYEGSFAPAVFSGTLDSGFVDGAASGARYGNLLDLAFDGADNLYVADQGNHRIRKVNVTEGVNYGDVSTLAGSSTGGHVDGTGAAAQFEGPNAFVVDPTAHLLYVADGATIRVVTPAGEVSTLVGSNSAYLDGDGCTAKFINAKSIAKFANELYVLDVNRIRKIVMN